eukprot:9279276-Lingulodinium_polyedra.AAC.1
MATTDHSEHIRTIDLALSSCSPGAKEFVAPRLVNQSSENCRRKWIDQRQDTTQFAGPESL